MSPSFSSRFFNPVMLWVDVALKTQEMMWSSGSVIQIRTERMALAGLSPSAADMAEFQLMGQEKLAAATESSAAITSQLQSSSAALLHRSVKHWFGGAAALVGLATSVTPAQAAAHSHQLLNVSKQAAANMAQFSSAGARVVQRGLKPIHAKATSNARRLSQRAA